MTAPSFVWAITGPWGTAGATASGLTDFLTRFYLARGIITSAGGAASGVRTALYNFTASDPAPALASGAWAAINSSTWDVSIPAVAGDTIEVGIRVRYANGVADHIFLDFATVLSSTPTNSWALGAALDPTNLPGKAGMAFVPSGAAGMLELSQRRACVSGDLSGGSLTLRLIGRANGAGVTSTFFGASGAAHLWLINYGQ